jgi:predicted O-methyltransferase YrrM
VTGRRRSIPRRLVYLAGAARATTAHPREGVERARERLAERRDLRDGPWRPAGTGDERELHDRLGLPWPCPDHDAFEAVWAGAVDTLAGHGLRAGRGAFGGWDDGDKRLCRIAWCLARHLRPERVLETGVGRGLTTRVLLEALERNGSGRLWSVDLPPLRERALAAETGAAVTPELRRRWTLVTGSSRHVLHGLLREIGPIDVFVHDSMHTTRNVTFELTRAWPALVAGGAALIDDVERNHGLQRFLAAHPDVCAVVCPAADGGALLACLLKAKPAAAS